MKIQSKEELKELAKKLGVRKDWHEPDEQDVTAEVRGKSFDNAGFWGLGFEGNQLLRPENSSYIAPEMYVVLSKNGLPVGEINLADLFAMATDGI